MRSANADNVPDSQAAVLPVWIEGDVQRSVCGGPMTTPQAIPGSATTSTGFYTLGEAARLVGVPQRRIAYWVAGDRRHPYPVIDRDYPSGGPDQVVSFLDLMEIRFLDYFRRQGLSLQYLRKAASMMRAELDSKHPFAYYCTEYLTDRKRIFVRLARSGRSHISEILGKQLEMYDIIEASLAKGVRFDPKTHVARRWRPEPQSYPLVVVDPLHAFGQPVVGMRRIPTSALYRSWKAEGGDTRRVADIWDASVDDVRQAVDFEITLAA